jgi:hypothetical protein
VRRGGRGAESGQATIELVATLPFLVAAALAAAGIVGFESARERAGQAAEAGALALLQDADPQRAARAALPDGERASVRVRGRRVTVVIDGPPALRALVPPLRARATADAGPEATP